MKKDLRRLQNNYFDAAIKNLDAGAEISLELVRQLINSTTFFIIFIATLFFFLQDKLSSPVLSLSLKSWLDLAIASGPISIAFGILNLSAGKRLLFKSGIKYFLASKKINDFIEKTDIMEVDTIPENLIVKDNEAKSDFKTNVYLSLQMVFFAVTILATIVPIITLLNR